MIDVESRAATRSSPGSGGGAGRVPTSRKICSAVTSSRPSGKSTHSAFGPVKRASPRISSSPGVSSMRRSEPDRNDATTARLRWRTAAMSTRTGAALYTVIGRTAGQVGNSGAGDHRLGGSAARVDACPTDMLSLDQRGPPPGSGQRTRQRATPLSGADDDRVIVLRITHADRPSPGSRSVSPSLAGRAGDCPEVRTRIPCTNAKFGEAAENRQRSAGEAAWPDLCIRGGEEVNAIGLFPVDCADGSCQVVAPD